MSVQRTKYGRRKRKFPHILFLVFLTKYKMFPASYFGSSSTDTQVKITTDLARMTCFSSFTSQQLQKSSVITGPTRLYVMSQVQANCIPYYSDTRIMT
jgi:hypothetical protein